MERPKSKASEPSTDLPDDPNRLRRVKLTWDEAIVQGDVMKKALAAESENLKRIAMSLASRSFSRVVITGCGDSWFSATGVRLAFERLLSIPTESMQALDFATYFYATSGRDTLVIGIASGGNTPAVMNALRHAREKGAYTLGVTNTENSPITQEFDASIIVRATRKGWPTQASTAAMAVMIQFAIELARVKNTCDLAVINSIQDALEQLPDLMTRVVETSNEQVRQLAEKLATARYMIFCGGGPHYAAACFGAAKVKELCPIHAMSIPLEEFHHYRSLKPGDPLFLVASDGPSHSRAVDTAEVGAYDGGRIFALVPPGEEEISRVSEWALHMPAVSEILAPMLYSVPLHLFAYHLAMAKFDRRLGFVPAFDEEEKR